MVHPLWNRRDHGTWSWCKQQGTSGQRPRKECLKTNGRCLPPLINDIVLKCHLIQVNLSYILWVAAFNTWFLFAYFILDILFYPPQEHSKTRNSSSTRDKGTKESVSNYQGKSLDQHPDASPAPLLDAINKNGLALFLFVSADSFLLPSSCQNKIRQTYVQVWSTCPCAQLTHPTRLV